MLARRVREITWFFRNKVFDETDIADLVSQTFLRCVSSRDRFAGDASFRRFVYAIAQNVLREYLRAKSKRARERLDFAEVCVHELRPTSPSSIHAKTRELRAFVEALREVPLDDQIVLELKYFEGLSAREIGETLHIPEGTVRGRLSRGLERLRARVQAHLAGEGRHDELPTPKTLEGWAAQVRAQRGAEP